MSKDFDAVTELIKLTCDAASYFWAWRDYVGALCENPKSLSEFYEAATTEEKEKFEAANKIVNDFEVAISKIQGIMLDLGVMRFIDDIPEE